MPSRAPQRVSAQTSRPVSAGHPAPLALPASFSRAARREAQAAARAVARAAVLEAREARREARAAARAARAAARAARAAAVAAARAAAREAREARVAARVAARAAAREAREARAAARHHQPPTQPDVSQVSPEDHSEPLPALEECQVEDSDSGIHLSLPPTADELQLEGANEADQTSLLMGEGPGLVSVRRMTPEDESYQSVNLFAFYEPQDEELPQWVPLTPTDAIPLPPDTDAAPSNLPFDILDMLPFTSDVVFAAQLAHANSFI